MKNKTTPRTKLSPIQKEVVEKMESEKATKLYRWPGGFWTTEKWDKEKHTGRNGIPEWYAGTNTVRALQKKGVFKKTKIYQELTLQLDELRTVEVQDEDYLYIDQVIEKGK